MKILLADDDQDILELLSYTFTKEGHDVLCAVNGQEAIDLAIKENPDVFILDIMMPILDGIETSKKIRTIDSLKDKIIILLTARSEEYSEVAGFEAGIDDYITKPIKLMALNARVKNLIKRTSKHEEEALDGTDIKIKDFIVSQSERLVYVGDQKIELPKKEFDILALLASKIGRVFTREQIYNEIWGVESVVSERTLDVHIRKLREKIGDAYIRTSKGVGYAFVG